MKSYVDVCLCWGSDDLREAPSDVTGELSCFATYVFSEQTESRSDLFLGGSLASLLAEYRWKTFCIIQELQGECETERWFERCALRRDVLADGVLQAQSSCFVAK